MKNNIILSLYKKPQTVFTLQEIALLFPEIPYGNLKKRMSYFAKSGAIKKLSRGIYAKDQFDVLELANKIYTPSYISLETVLQKAGVTFQYYESIFAITYVSRTVKVDKYTIEYRRIRTEVLLDKQGIEEQGKKRHPEATDRSPDPARGLRLGDIPGLLDRQRQETQPGQHHEGDLEGELELDHPACHEHRVGGEGDQHGEQERIGKSQAAGDADRQSFAGHVQPAPVKHIVQVLRVDRHPSDRRHALGQDDRPDEHGVAQQGGAQQAVVDLGGQVER